MTPTNSYTGVSLYSTYNASTSRFRCRARLSEEAQIVIVRRIAVTVFLQPDDSLVTFHVVGQVDTDTADRVMYDAIYEERDVGH